MKLSLSRLTTITKPAAVMRPLAPIAAQFGLPKAEVLYLCVKNSIPVCYEYTSDADVPRILLAPNAYQALLNLLEASKTV